MADLYSTLELDKQATQQDIKKAYKRLAVKYHPDKNPDPTAKTQFEEVKKAYDTLSDPRRRSNYDHPVESILGHIFGRVMMQNIDMTLEEAYAGTTKLLDGVTVGFKAGVHHNTRLTVNDKLYRINIVPHPVFARNNADLLITLNISTVEAIFGKKVEVTHLDNTKFTFTIEEGAFTGQVMRFSGKGMIDQLLQRRGDLYVQITVDPISGKDLTSDVRDAIIHAYSKQMNQTKVIK